MSKSGSGANTPQKLPKTMSSRLSNMKFMQRAGGSVSLPHSPGSGSEPPSAKRVKTSHEKSPAQANAHTPQNDQDIRPLGSNGAETMWTFENATDHLPERDITHQNDDDSPPWEVGDGQLGRMTFGTSRSTAKKSSSTSDTHNFKSEPDDSDHGDDDGDSASIDSHDDESAGSRKFAEANLARVKAALADKKRSDREKNSQRFKDRKKKEVRLNSTGSGRIGKPGRKGISSGGR